ncbi:MAG: leucine-rich repeat protein [Spirochaetaceae bacterium]|jgi:hypothetical protein|nr:leucine-rich repeat protein [Spirochaetaceae bacterium]
MKTNFRFAKQLVWGSIAFLMIIAVGCSPLTGPDSDPPPWEETEEVEKTENAEDREDAENTGDTEDTEEQEDTEDTGNPEDGKETGESGEAGDKEDAGGSSEQDSKDESGENGEQNSGDAQDKPEDQTGGDGEQGSSDGQEPGEEQGNAEGNGNAEIPVSGGLAIRIGEMERSEGVYPDMGAITRYLLDFFAGDGKTAESLYLDAGEELAVTLDAGEWEIRAYGIMERGAGPPIAVIRGTARATVREGATENVLVVPDGPAASGGEQGFLSWRMDYPEGKTWGAVLAVFIKTGGNSFIPYKYFDLTAPGMKEQKVSLPPGTYRAESRFMSHNANAGSTETVHIFPGLETASRLSGAVGNSFPDAAEFASVSELKTYLDGLPENTAAAPYPIKIAGVDLSSKEKTGDTLNSLYAALDRRYVTLDLRECTGTEFLVASTNRLANRANIVSLILPGSITSIPGNGFSGYTSLESVVLPKVTTIDYAAFNNLKKLETVSAPEAITIVDAVSTSADRGSFYKCDALKSVYFPKLETIGHHTFYSCASLTGAAFPSLRIVGGLAFKGCAALEAVSLPTVTRIAKSAFEDNTALKYLVFGSKPPELEADIFKGGGFSQTGVIYTPPDAVSAYQDSDLPNWPGLKGLVKPLSEPAVL